MNTDFDDFAFFRKGKRRTHIKELIEERERRYIIRFLLFVPHTTVKNDAYYYCRSYIKELIEERETIHYYSLFVVPHDTKDFHDACCRRRRQKRL